MEQLANEFIRRRRSIAVGRAKPYPESFRQLPVRFASRKAWDRVSSPTTTSLGTNNHVVPSADRPRWTLCRVRRDANADWRAIEMTPVEIRENDRVSRPFAANIEDGL